MKHLCNLSDEQLAAAYHKARCEQLAAEDLASDPMSKAKATKQARRTARAAGQRVGRYYDEIKRRRDERRSAA